MPGGHIEKNETPLEAAQRELYEEAGIVNQVLTPVCDYYAEDQFGNAYGRVFYCEADKLGTLPESEIEEVKLFAEFPENTTYTYICDTIVKAIEDFEDQFVLLMNVGSETDAGFISGLLENEEIIIFSKHRESGEISQIYLGKSSFGIDIYVPSKRKAEAEKIIRASINGDNNRIATDYEPGFDFDEEADLDEEHLDIDVDMAYYKNEAERKRKFKVWIMLALFFIPSIIGTLVGVAIKFF